MSKLELKKIIIDRINDLIDTKDLINWSANLNEFFLAYKSHELLQPAFNNIHKKNA